MSRCRPAQSNCPRRARFSRAALLLGILFNLQRVAWADTADTSTLEPDTQSVEPDKQRHEEGAWTPCARCRIWLGLGATFDFWDWTQGVVVPLTFEFDEARWELGAFRLSSRQIPSSSTGASSAPYWGFSAMRRWQILHRGSQRLYVGFGGNYVTRESYELSSLWNLSFVIAWRWDPGGRKPLVEFSVRHWSNAWLKLPDRGQTFFAVSASF